MKKCYHIKLCATGFSNDGISKGFRDCGYETHEIDWQAYKFHFGLRRLREKIISDCEDFRPDIIFFQTQNPEILDIPTVQKLERIGRVVNFTFDVRNFDSTVWMYEMSNHVSLTAFSNQEDVDNCTQFGGGNAIVLQSSCDMEFYHKVDPVPNKWPEIVFIGNNYEGSNLNFPHAKDRQKMIGFMYENFKDKFAAYGLGQREKYLTPEMERECLSTAKVVICQSNYRRYYYCSDRVWRAMACDALVMHEYFAMWNKVFESRPLNSMCYVPNDLTELKRICEAIVFLPKREDGVFRRYVSENHSYSNRVKQLEEQLNQSYFAKEYLM